MKKLGLAIAVLGLSGCASMFTGTTSTVNVTSTPSGADCDLAGRGVHTPGNVVLPKSSNDVAVNCQLPGYQPASSIVSSSFNPVTLLDTCFGLGGVLAYIIDFSSGAAFEYQDHVSLNLIKEPIKVAVFEEPAPITFAPPAPVAKEIQMIDYFKDKRGRCFVNDENGKKQRTEKSFCQ